MDTLFFAYFHFKQSVITLWKCWCFILFYFFEKGGIFDLSAKKMHL